jgi:hypothetical protein
MTLTKRFLTLAIVLCAPFMGGNMVMYVEAAAGPTPTATPTAAPTPTATPTAAPGGQLFTEDCDTTLDVGWTEASTSGSSVDIVTGECLGNMGSNDVTAALIQGPLDGTDEFCSMQITDTASTNRKHGCTFRAQNNGTPDPNDPGIHYFAFFNNKYNNYSMEHHSTSHGFVDEVKGLDHCSCGSYTDIHDGDYVGITISGTGASTNIKWWDWGGSLPEDGFDIEDPSTWTSPAEACECIGSEFAANVSEGNRIDVAGDCGPEMSSRTSGEILFDNFACGDIP